jgi:SAM-dependent methyltransferase
MLAPEQIRDDNVRYHDLAAPHYDTKWGISYGRQGQAQVVAKLGKALGRAPEGFSRGLEIGAGTGYFSLNLLRAGVLSEAVATDISPGMLGVLDQSAQRMRLPVTTRVCEAGELPFEDDSFDLVFGHAVLHHLPDLEGSFREFRRVLKPGGSMAFCGEPSYYGDRLASWPKRGAYKLSPLWRRALRAGERRVVNGNGGGMNEEARLEQVVDVHAFTPADLAGHARAAGLTDVRVHGEELAASLFGWVNRTLEGTAEPEDLPRAWYLWAHRGYLALQRLDRVVLEGRLPAALFYNLLVSARTPA